MATVKALGARLTGLEKIGQLSGEKSVPFNQLRDLKNNSR